MDLFKIENLSFNYLGFPAIWENLNFTIKAGKFTLLIGPSGAGKTCLIKQFIYKLAPFGNRTGKIFYKNQDLETLSAEERVKKFGCVAQNVEEQIISESVWQELAFSLEELGVEPNKMRLRIAEIANFFGIQEWFWNKTNELSGGQKQILNLASAMTLKPEILFLDEAESSLDPVSKIDFLNLLKRINSELGTNILLSSHNWPEVLPLADDILYLDEQKIQYFDSPHAFSEYILAESEKQHISLPISTRISHLLNKDLVFSNGEAKVQLEEFFLENTENNNLREIHSENIPTVTKETSNKTSIFKLCSQKMGKTQEEKNTIVEVKNLSFKYKKVGKNILDNLNLKIPKASFTSILGGNGSGKSSLLKCLLGELDYSGKVKWNVSEKRKARLAYLPQNVRLLFSSDSIIAEIRKAFVSLTIDEKSELAKIFNLQADNFSPESLLEKFKLSDRANFHPSDLSGGELQRAAIALVLLNQPDVLLLDEISNNLSIEDLQEVKLILKTLLAKGLSIIAVSHDLEFCAELSDHCALLFQGEIVSFSKPQDFFSNNYFYTTDACRISQGLVNDAQAAYITSNELLEKIKAYIVKNKIEFRKGKNA